MPASNFVSELKSGEPHPAHLKVPVRFSCRAGPLQCQFCYQLPPPPPSCRPNTNSQRLPLTTDAASSVNHQAVEIEVCRCHNAKEWKKGNQWHRVQGAGLWSLRDRLSQGRVLRRRQQLPPLLLAVRYLHSMPEVMVDRKPVCVHQALFRRWCQQRCSGRTLSQLKLQGPCTSPHKKRCHWQCFTA